MRSAYAPHPGSEFDDEVVFTVPKTTEDLVEKPDALALDLLRYALFSVNLSDHVDTPEKLEELIRKGYEYNCWSPPTNLQT
jgi:hypothetical protein